MENNNFKQTQRSDTAQLVELLSRLHLALKNIQVYPEKHPLVRDKLSIAHHFLAKILIYKKSLLFGIARNVFTYNAEPIGEMSLSCEAFAKTLSRHEVASVHFSYGISQHTLFVFLRAAGILPEQKISGNRHQQELSSINLPHINIETIDFSCFDQKNGSNHSPREQHNKPLTWLSFNQKLTGGMLTLSDNKHGTPEALAEAINKQAPLLPKTLKDFSALLDQMLRRIHREQLVPTSFGGAELGRVLTALKPEIRSQFIEATLLQCNHGMDGDAPEKVLSKFSDSILQQLFQHADKNQTTSSPALLILLNKLSEIRFPVDSALQKSPPSPKNTGTCPPLNEHERHTKPPHCNIPKLRISSTTTSITPSNFPLDQHITTLEEGYLNRQIVRATLILMGQAPNEREYAELAEQLMELCLVLPDNGAFDLLQSTAKTLLQQAAEKNSQVINSITERCIQRLSDSNFLDYIYSILPELSLKEKKDALDLFRYFCPAIIDKLLNIYCIKPLLRGEDPLLAIFMDFRLETLTSIFTILPKSNTNTLKKLLNIIEHLGIQGTVRLLHPLLDHEDEDIRLKVLSILLPSYDEEAIAILVSMLGSENTLVADSAIELCNSHQPSSCTPALINLLEFNCLKQVHITRNIKLFLILSRIGDKSALPYLEKIAFSKWPFLHEQITAMKRILFYSLKGYQNEDRIELLQKGMKIRDEEIRKICNNLLPSRLREKGTK